MKAIKSLSIIFVLLWQVIGVFGQLQTKNLIVITLDGLRWQEVFTGADSLLLNNNKITQDVEGFNLKYWNTAVNTRRQMLMPFLWETLAANGQLYGNRNFDCVGYFSIYYIYNWSQYTGYQLSKTKNTSFG